MPSFDIAVVGAGPAGLMAARQLARGGRSVVVLERSDAVGGMAGSFDVAGVRVDHGSHRLHPATSPPLLRTLRELLGDDLQVRPRHGRIRLEDRWVAFPLRTGDLVRHLPRRFAAGAVLDALVAPARRPRADTFSEVVRAGLGPTVARAFYDPYTTKLWGVPPAELSGELARRRVSASSPVDIARRLVRGARPEGRTFLYPRRGFGQVSEALAGDAVDGGADLRLGCAVERLSPGRDEVRITLADGPAITAGHVWSTAPLPLLASMIDPPVPDAALDAASRLEHRGLVLAYLVVDRGAYTTFDAHYFPALDNPLSRLSEPKRYRDGDDPADVTVLCAEIPCTSGDATWNASAPELQALVEDALIGAGLPHPRSVAVEVRRLPRVYPVYRPGFERDLAGVEAWLASQSRLLTFGRQGLFVPDNTHHALAMGAAAAALRDDGTLDAGAWRSARDGFRSNVVED